MWHTVWCSESDHWIWSADLLIIALYGLNRDSFSYGCLSGTDILLSSPSLHPLWEASALSSWEVGVSNYSDRKWSVGSHSPSSNVTLVVQEDSKLTPILFTFVSKFKVIQRKELSLLWCGRGNVKPLSFSIPTPNAPPGCRGLSSLHNAIRPSLGPCNATLLLSDWFVLYFYCLLKKGVIVAIF